MDNWDMDWQMVALVFAWAFIFASVVGLFQVVVPTWYQAGTRIEGMSVPQDDLLRRKAQEQAPEVALNPVKTRPVRSLR